MKRSGMTGGYGNPLGRGLAGANRHGSPLLADSDKTRVLLDERGGLHGRIAHKSEKAPSRSAPRPLS